MAHSVEKASPTDYFSIDQAINCNMHTKSVFIIANERMTKSGQVGRYYTVFPCFKDFLRRRNDYPHCHELLVDHINNDKKMGGRLVFDFDIKSDVPADFKKQIEYTVADVVIRFFTGVDDNILEFVWSTSHNPKKFSKHLTVKNLYFDNWMSMSKIFYKLFCNVWDESHLWISSSELIDFQIVRKNGSLRMVGSTKINGYPLIFDGPHHLTDSLIRIYFKKDMDLEQMVRKENIVKDVFNKVLDGEDRHEVPLVADHSMTIGSTPRKVEKPSYEPIIYQKAYEVYESINPGIFKMGKIRGNILSLVRKAPSPCMLSGKMHEHENSFIKIIKDNFQYSLDFGCYRYCSPSKTINIGTMSIDNFMVDFNPKFATEKRRAKMYCIK